MEIVNQKVIHKTLGEGLITWFGGNVPAPNACLVSARTTTSLTKQVVIIKILGASVNIVNQIRI